MTRITAVSVSALLLLFTSLWVTVNFRRFPFEFPRPRRSHFALSALVGRMAPFLGAIFVVREGDVSSSTDCRRVDRSLGMKCLGAGVQWFSPKWSFCFSFRSFCHIRRKTRVPMSDFRPVRSISIMAYSQFQRRIALPFEHLIRAIIAPF